MITKTIREIKYWLIHKLGGYTIGELIKAHNTGRHKAALELKEHADTLYGKDLQTWCNDLYYYLCNMYLTEYSSQDYDYDNI